MKVKAKVKGGALLEILLAVPLSPKSELMEVQWLANPRALVLGPRLELAEM